MGRRGEKHITVRVNKIKNILGVRKEFTEI